MQNAREIVIKTLYKIEYEGAYLNIALKEALLSSDLDTRDKAFVTRLVYGIVQRKLELEYIISCYSSIKIKKISKFVLLILKLGIYELLYMDKIPESASVNESVKLANRFGAGKSRGFINGILRSFAREKTYPEPTDKTEAISVKYSFPKWLTEKWIKDFGEDFAVSLMESLNKDTPTQIRVNTLKTTREEMLLKIPNSKPSEFSKNAITVSGFDVVGSEEYKNGFITPQNVSAMLAVEVLNPKENESIIDLCASPGGKSGYIAELMKNKGKLLSFDIHPHKIALIEETAKRLSADIIEAGVGDATVFNPKYKEAFDKVLADVLCSGLGIIKTKPDIKWKEPADLSKIQYSILKNASGYLKKGGELLYSTCTISKEENEEIIEKFLAENPDFKGVDISEFIPEALCSDTAKKGYITLYPNLSELDGFFIAKIKKV